MFADTTVEKKDSGDGVGEGSAVLGSISGGSAVMVSATLKFRKKQAFCVHGVVGQAVNGDYIKKS